MHVIESLFHFFERVHAKAFTIVFSPCFESFGTKSSLTPPVKIVCADQMRIGNRVVIESFTWIQVIRKKKEKEQPAIVFEDGVLIGMGATISAVSRITIRRDTLIARNVFICDHRHAYEDLDRSIGEQGISNIGEVEIGEHSWVGQNAIILPGVRIGKHCIVGANAVVNKSMPDYSVCAGIPARVIRMLVPAAGSSAEAKK
jgi:acetyltransferase-like isoleucine patch superfamily enzyme